ncbi:MAG: hypothetical protein NZ580_02915 [Bacteroidia bacterium]|nr:hypothetical protein [Bacteroidia bacterium]MDW8236647.1 hypothetical protein [Bacteroidia bacterium]
MEITIWLRHAVAFHPRGYYRLARTLARRFSVSVWGRPFPPACVEGPLQPYIDKVVWSQLSTPPQDISTYTDWRGIPPVTGVLIAMHPLDIPWAFLRGRSPLLWDVWEDYEANFRFEPAYSFPGRVVRRGIWTFLRLWLSRVRSYSLAEYPYTLRFPARRSRVFPNAFIEVESAPPLLPHLAGQYALYSGNITWSWGIAEAVSHALQHPNMPLVIAGSIKDKKIASWLRTQLAHHSRWLLIHASFLPYPLIQNLQRYARFLYAFYQPLPHLREKIPGKFYEAAVLGVPVLYTEGVSIVWDSFWQLYRREGVQPWHKWSYYENELLKWMGELL